MKRFILPIILLAISLQFAQSQSFKRPYMFENQGPSLSVASVAMRSVRGWKYGIEVGLTTRKDLYIGGFSYTSRPSSEGRIQKDTYHGLHISFPLVKIDRLSILSDQKIGFYNKRFFSILPTLALKYDANKRISAAVGAGISDRLPVFNFKLIFQLKNKLKR